MQGCWTVMACFNERQNTLFDAAFINGEIISWISRNNSKPGREGLETWTIHANPEWSQQWIEIDKEEGDRRYIGSKTESILHRRLVTQTSTINCDGFITLRRFRGLCWYCFVSLGKIFKLRYNRRWLHDSDSDPSNSDDNELPLFNLTVFGTVVSNQIPLDHPQSAIAGWIKNAPCPTIDRNHHTRQNENNCYVL